MQQGRRIVHVDNRSTNGRAVDLAQKKMKRFHDRGYAVAPVPEDGFTHPYDQPCPVCTVHLPDVTRNVVREMMTRARKQFELVQEAYEDGHCTLQELHETALWAGHAYAVLCLAEGYAPACYVA